MERLTQIKLYNRLLECYLVKKQRLEAEIERQNRMDPSKPYQLTNYEMDSLAKVQIAINELV